MKFLIFSVTLLCAICFINGEKVRFDGYKLYKIFIDSKDQLNALKLLSKEENDSFEIWKEGRFIGDSTDIMVSPDYLDKLKNLLEEYQLRSNVTIENIQKLIDIQTPLKQSKRKLEWENYHTLDEIYEWLDKILLKFPKEVSSFCIGKSYEGRNIRGIRISYKDGNPAIFIEANIHAREWISSATITWIINQLLNSKDLTVRDIAENIDWYIIPVLNVDGFVYTHEKNRMWRKTRQPHGSSCIGVDPNRNFDFLWMTAGASNDPCSETYAGPNPNSEPEIKLLTEFIETIPNRIDVYISLHSYGQYVLSPWGHTDTEFPENYDDMMAVATGFAESAKQKFGTVYVCGSSSTVLYKVSGSSKEWAYGVRGIPFPYTIELRDTGLHGFLLPPDQIIPTGKEVLDGMVGLVEAARKLHYLETR